MRITASKLSLRASVTAFRLWIFDGQASANLSAPLPPNDQNWKNNTIAGSTRGATAGLEV